MVDLTGLRLLYFLNDTLTAVRIAAAITKELIRLSMFFADSVLLGNLVNRNFLVGTKEITSTTAVMELLETGFTEILMILHAVNLSCVIRVLYAWDFLLLTFTCIYCYFCLNFMKQLSPLRIKYQVLVLVNAFRLIVILNIN